MRIRQSQELAGAVNVDLSITPKPSHHPTMQLVSYAAALFTVLFLVSSPQGAQDSGAETWIVFGSWRGGDYAGSVYAIRPDGSDERRLSKHASGLPNCIEPRVSHDKQRVLFGRGGGGSHRTGVWDMAVDGSDERKLTEKVMTRFRRGRLSASASPDGKQIAYVADHEGKRTLFVAKSDGSEEYELCEGEHAWWSPARDEIVFIREHDEAHQIWIATADGSEERRLTSGRATGYPSWTPDGERILFSRNVGERADLFLVGRDGEGIEQVTETPEVSETQATMSPDGAWIAYVAKTGAGPNGWEKSVYVVPTDGGAARQVTSSAHNETSPTWLVKE